MSEKPQIKYLKDYRPLTYTIENVELVIDIESEKATVMSILTVKKNNDESDELFLNGEGLKLKSVYLDGVEIRDYTLHKDGLGLKLDQELKEFTLKITNTFDPYHNSALEGLYKSGNILCTQCEPEGFRRITYFIDRPDNMSSYITTIKADKATFPYLLSNGDRIDYGDLPGGRHFATWKDPFRKPSYLFALVAGDLELVEDSYQTMSGRKVAIEFYVDHGNGEKCGYAIKSLKQAMKWDEDTFGLEYDLNTYMVVAVESFNFGAMENKGLNIFNSGYVLANKETATDANFQAIQGVIGHEYFHNWTGNRITCRDWFQLTLKEGLTVFRDQEFSSDMLSRSVKRIEDVIALKEHQFPEDAGPMSHPIKPSSFIEINNFYSMTVYEKGAEVIRMIETLLGKESFRKGITTYFELFDGQAVTTEDFILAMEKASGKDLTQFKNWYHRPGTPKVFVKKIVNEGSVELSFKQSYPATTEELKGNVLVIPLKMKVYNDLNEVIYAEKVVELKNIEESLTVKGATKDSFFSLNRDFSAPVYLEFEQSVNELIKLVKYDDNPYVRYQSVQDLYYKFLADQLMERNLSLELPHYISECIEHLIKKEKDESFMTLLLGLPSQGNLIQKFQSYDFDLNFKLLKNLKMLLGKSFQSEWLRLFNDIRPSQNLDPENFGKRSLRNIALSFYEASVDAISDELIVFFKSAANMTEKAFALNLVCSQYEVSSHKAQELIDSFYQEWSSEPLVMLKWYAAQSGFITSEEVFSKIERIENDKVFRSQVPNDIRSLYESFGRHNLVNFHHASGKGYDLMIERVKRVDQFNPAIAARISSVFSIVQKLDKKRREYLTKKLKALLEEDISKDLFEKTSNYLSKS